MARRLLAAALSALVLCGAGATMARADDLKLEVPTTLTDRNQWGPQTVHKSFQWDAGKSRWGLKLDMDQAPGPPDRNTAYQDLHAGAYYKLTPSLSVGGGVAVRDQAMSQAQGNPQGPTTNAPRVRLETAFKF